MTTMYVKEVLRSDEPTYNYHLTLRFPSAFQHLLIDCFVLWPVTSMLRFTLTSVISSQ